MEDGVTNLLSNRSAIETKDLTKTLPKNFFQIQDNVYAVRCIPENVLFGPYIGSESLRNNTGYTWILNGGRQTEVDNKHLYNWIRCVQFSKDESECNLTVVQSNGFLYYRCNRDIACGERLLAHLDDRLVKNFTNNTGKYYCPIEVSLPHVYACIPCCLGFNAETNLRQHLQQRRCLTNNNARSISIEIVQCPLCKMVSANKRDIKHHLRNNCANKKRSTSSKAATKNPHNTNKEELHRCIVCEAVFKYRTNLKRHMNGHEKGKKFGCYQCGYKTDRKSYLKSHIISKHTGEYACHRCDFVAKRKRELKLHKITVHSNEAPKANKTVIEPDKNIPNTITDSNSSKSNNSDETSHNINDIASTSSTSGAVNNKYKCSMCNKELTEKATLRRHIKAVHAGEKPHRCEHCNYKCASTGSLYKHLKIHTGEKPHVCQICNRKFLEKCKLRRHMKVHTRERYPCGHCGHQARTSVTLHKHMERVHNIHVSGTNNKTEQQT